MRKMPTFSLLTLTASIFLFAFALSPLSVFGQDSPSLGDAARQARMQKQQKEAQAKDAAGKDATSKDPATKDTAPASITKKTPKIITNEEIPEHVGPAARPPASDDTYHAVSHSQPSGVPSEAKGEELKSQIASMKSGIASTQSQIDSLNDSIHFAGGNCVANCVQWNERQLQKQRQVEQMKAQLEDQKKQLEDLQESARQQGFGSSVYDP
jgi:cell wall-associated NlpC family hydrolase